MFALPVGIGRGNESTEGGGDINGEVGREDARFTSRLLAAEDFFLSLDDVGVGIWRSDGLSLVLAAGEYGICSVDSDAALRSSLVTASDPAEENEPSRCRLSSAAAGCWRSGAPSMVCVLGRKEACRRGGLEEELSSDPPNESLNTMPCRRPPPGTLLPPIIETVPRPAPGIDLGEVCGDSEPRPRG